MPEPKSESCEGVLKDTSKDEIANLCKALIRSSNQQMAIVEKFKADLVKQQEVYCALQDLLDAKLEEKICQAGRNTVEE